MKIGIIHGSNKPFWLDFQKAVWMEDLWKTDGGPNEKFLYKLCDIEVDAAKEK